MTRPKAHAANERIGLRWRDGHPRWDAGPSARLMGIKTRDLKDGDRWLTMGEAIDVAGARAQLAMAIRRAAQDRDAIDPAVYARNWLKRFEARPATSTAPLIAALSDDLVDQLRAIAANGETPIAASIAQPDEPRTLGELRRRYLEHPTTTDPVHGVKPRTLEAYRGQSKKLLERFGPDKLVASVTAGDLRSWYVELTASHSLATAKAALAAAGALFAFARVQLDWITEKPATDLDVRRVPGRRVLWPLDVEKAFVAWCDANGFEDVGDAVTLGCWTGARSGDMCRAIIADLSGEVWRYLPEKTEATGHWAMPGVVDQVRERVQARRESEAFEGTAAAVIGLRPFLIFPAERGAHTARTIGDRFRAARERVRLSPDPLLAHVGRLMLKDTRKSCVTRLALSGVELDRIYQWTGHSPEEAKEVLRESYIVLTDEGSRAMAEQLRTWAQGQGVEL